MKIHAQKGNNMASLVVNNGLQRIGVQASQATGTGVTYSATRQIQSMSWDDSTTAFAAGHTALDSGGAVTNEIDANFDSTPTRSSQTISHIATIAAGSFNGNTVKRVALHDNTAANVSTSSTTLVAGVDAQSIVKNADFSLTTTMNLLYTNV